MAIMKLSSILSHGIKYLLYAVFLFLFHDM